MSLENRVELYIERSQSEEYKRAKRLVLDHEAAQRKLKDDYKKIGISKLLTPKGTLEFEIGSRTTVDTHSMPDELKEQYKKIIDIWRERIY